MFDRYTPSGQEVSAQGLAYEEGDIEVVPDSRLPQTKSVRIGQGDRFTDEPGSSIAPKGRSSFKSKATSAVAAVSAMAESPAGKAAVKKVSSRLPDPVNKAAAGAIKSTQRSFKVDTSSPSVEKSAASPSTAATSPASTVHTIEIVQKKRSTSCFWLIFQKKYMVAFLVLALLGVTGYLLSEYLAIPGLDAQIKELESEVDRLTEQVNRLEQANDRFGVLNDELEANNEEYAAQNDRLERSNAFYSELNNQLNASNMELLNLNEFLNASNIEYGRLNGQLTNTIEDLNTQVDVLESVNTDLTATVLEYIKLNEGLSEETDTLDKLNADLTENLLSLNGALAELRAENGQLVELLDDLSTIASFLNETSSGLEQSYEYIANYLAEQIVANRAILTETLHNTLRQQTINWVCGLSIKFATEDFASDGTIPIGAERYPEVISFVEDNVLSVLCLDTGDFESYLASQVGDDIVPPTNTGLNTLMMSVMVYSNDAMSHYFPDAGETGGLSEAAWADASFRCENLPQESRFLFNS